MGELCICDALLTKHQQVPCPQSRAWAFSVLHLGRKKAKAEGVNESFISALISNITDPGGEGEKEREK